MGSQDVCSCLAGAAAHPALSYVAGKCMLLYAVVVSTSKICLKVRAPVISPCDHHAFLHLLLQPNQQILIITLHLQVQASTEYVGGLCLQPDQQQVVVAAGDGKLSLSDLRKGGEMVSHFSCGSPLLCCQTDGQIAAAGAQDGQVGHVQVMFGSKTQCSMDLTLTCY